MYGERLRRIILLLFLVGLCAGASCSADSASSSPLVMGIFPRRSFNDTTRMFLPLARELSQRLGREVRLETAPDFPSFWRGIESGRYDIAHLNQYQYLRAHRELGYRVFGMNKEFHQTSMSAIIVVRRDSPIKSLRDLRGKRILFGGDRTAMLSYIVPTYMLRRAGLRRGDYMEEFAVTPFNTGIAAYYRQADAGTGSNVLLQQDPVKSRIDTSKLRVIAQGHRVAGLPWVAKRALSDEELKRISRALFDLAKTPGGRAILAAAELDAIVPAHDADYNSARRIVRAVLNEAY